MNVHEMLVEARNYFDEAPHWQYGQPNSAGDGLCPVLALTRAEHCLLQQGESIIVAVTTYGEALGVLADVLGEDVDSIAFCKGVADWNDAPGRTKQEVLELFDRAIAATAPQPDVEFLTDRELVSA